MPHMDSAVRFTCALSAYYTRMDGAQHMLLDAIHFATRTTSFRHHGKSGHLWRLHSAAARALSHIRPCHLYAIIVYKLNVRSSCGCQWYFEYANRFTEPWNIRIVWSQLYYASAPHPRALAHTFRNIPRTGSVVVFRMTWFEPERIQSNPNHTHPMGHSTDRSVTGKIVCGR